MQPLTAAKPTIVSNKSGLLQLHNRFNDNLSWYHHTKCHGIWMLVELYCLAKTEKVILWLDVTFEFGPTELNCS